MIVANACTLLQACTALQACTLQWSTVSMQCSAVTIQCSAVQYAAIKYKALCYSAVRLYGAYHDAILQYFPVQYNTILSRQCYRVSRVQYHE